MSGPPPRVLLDNQIFASQIRGGISRYFAELLRNRAALGDDLSLGLRLPATLNQHLCREIGYEGLRLRLPANPRAAALLRRVVNELGAYPPRGWRKSELLHHTFYRPEILDRTPGTLRACTLYDMIPELRPEHFPAGNPHGAKRLYLERSDLIISISRSSADEMIDVWPHLASREIAVVPLGVGDEFTDEGPVLRAPRPFLLFVGNRKGYKNFSVLLRALAVARGDIAELDLLAVGGGAFTSAESAEIAALGLSDRVTQTALSDQDLASAYRGAVGFVFPSVHEGFGLPILEAMACGCPTFLAESTVFREVAGQAAQYFDSTSPDSLLEALSTLSDASSIARLRSEGLRHAASRTWRQTAAATGDAYRRVL